MTTCGDCGGPLTGSQRRWCSPECQQAGARAVRLAAIFNLTPDEYDLILTEQGGGCGVCGRTPTPGKRNAVDHDHKTGLVRGLLCPNCNLRLVGRARDGALLRRAADYLDDPPARRALGRDVVAPGRPAKKRKPRRKPRRTGQRRAA